MSNIRCTCCVFASGIFKGEMCCSFLNLGKAKVDREFLSIVMLYLVILSTSTPCCPPFACTKSPALGATSSLLCAVLYERWMNERPADDHFPFQPPLQLSSTEAENANEPEVRREKAPVRLFMQRQWSSLLLQLRANHWLHIRVKKKLARGADLLLRKPSERGGGVLCVCGFFFLLRE